MLRVWDGDTLALVTQSRSHSAGPFASACYGVNLLTSTETQKLLETGGYDSSFDAVCSAVTSPQGTISGDPEYWQLARGLLHRLSAPARDAFQLSFLQHSHKHRIDTNLELNLVRLIQMSKEDAKLAVAAGNAASCLNWLDQTRQSSSLAGLDLSGVRLTGADLRGANLTGTRFVNAELTDCDFTGSLLIGADFSGVDLAASTFASTNRVLPGSPFAMSALQESRDSVFVASVVDGNIFEITRLDSGERAVVSCRGFGSNNGSCLFFGIQSDGKLLLASGSEDRNVRVWNAEAGEMSVLLEGHTDKVTCLSFGRRSDGNLVLASGSDDTTVRLWDVEAGGKSVIVLPVNGLTGAVAGAGNNDDERELRLLYESLNDRERENFHRQVKAGGDRTTVLRRLTSAVSCLSFGTRSDGRLVLASGCEDKKVRLWNAEAGATGDAIVLSGHAGRVSCLSFGIGKHGKLLLASGSKDSAIRLWDTEASGDAVAVLSGHTADVTCLSFTSRPDGGLLLASSSNDNSSAVGCSEWRMRGSAQRARVLSSSYFPQLCQVSRR